MERNFIADVEKISDMIILSKDEFLQSYSYITEQEYENTINEILGFIKSRNKMYEKLNVNINKNKKLE